MTPPPNLAALILELEALEAQHIRDHMGRAVYQFGLTLLSRTNEPLAQILHDWGDAKPFTASGLMRGDAPLFGNVAAGERAWVRLTVLDADVAACLVAYHEAVCAGGRFVEEINRQQWRVINARWDDTRLPGLTTYQTLINRHERAPVDDRLTLRFVTATSFHSLGLNSPLPRPDLIFGSLQSRWRAFTALNLRELPEDHFGAFLNYHVEVSRADIRTDRYKGKQGSTITGFLGTVSFDLLRNSPYLMKQNAALEQALRDDAAWYLRTLQLLGDFAVFSGVGRKTTTGFGMVR